MFFPVLLSALLCFFIPAMEDRVPRQVMAFASQEISAEQDYLPRRNTNGDWRCLFDPSAPKYSRQRGSPPFDLEIRATISAGILVMHRGSTRFGTGQHFPTSKLLLMTHNLSVFFPESENLPHYASSLQLQSMLCFLFKNFLIFGSHLLRFHLPKSHFGVPRSIPRQIPVCGECNG